MKLLQLTATFGCLQGDTLEFGPGMTLINLPTLQLPAAYP